MEKAYRTPEGRAEGEFVQNKSRFIGTLAPVQTQEEALAFIEEKKKQYWNATHHVFAYLLRDGTARCSDDGEPQGTAGVPTLDVLQKEGLVDVVVVVTRYFGGVLLGAGGLVRAYSHAAKLSVDAAVIQVMTLCKVVLLELDYSFYGKVNTLLPRFGAVTKSSDFGVIVRLELVIDALQFDAFAKALEELTAAQVYPRVTDTLYYDMRANASV